ncbi:MAG: tetratricopeptide repeat protein, partial [Ferruginibacter sp.]
LELQGRLQLLKKNGAEAISFYRKFNELEPNNPAVQYSIARLYAQANKNHDALQWLRRSIASGFNYSWVLDADDSWNEYRNKADWKTISKTMVAKTYAE